MEQAIEKFKLIFKLPDLRIKIVITLVLLILVRVLAHIPLPGVDLETLREFFQNNQIFGFLNMFSGGTMSNFSIILMGVGPYITASIIIQLLGLMMRGILTNTRIKNMMVKGIEGDIRYLTVPLA